MEEQIIKFEDVLIGCVRKWRSILVFTILTTVLAALVSIVSNDMIKYEGTAELYVKNEATVIENNIEVKKDKNLIQNYMQLMKTKDFVAESLYSVDSKLKPEEALGKLTVTNIVNTDFIQIKYSSLNKNETAEVLQGVINEFTAVAPNYNKEVEIIVEESIGIAQKQEMRSAKVLIAMGLIGGLCMSTAIAFILECINKTFKTKGELERELKMPIIANVPKVKKNQININKIKNNQGTILGEAYNSLATTIKHSKGNFNNKSILITSSIVGEGSTTTASSLAVSLATSNKRVILLEGDLRKPSLHNVFEVKNDIGLSDVILKKINLDNAVKKINDNLDLLTAGELVLNPIEIIDSKDMNLLLEDLKSKYDYIVIDTPPLQAVTDAQILSTKVDLTILVVRAEEVKKDTVKESIALINRVDRNIMGIVFNAGDTIRNKYHKYGN